MTARADFVEDVNVECEALIRKVHHRLLDFSKLELDVQTGGMIVNQNEKWSEKQEQLRQTLIAQEQRVYNLCVIQFCPLVGGYVLLYRLNI